MVLGDLKIVARTNFTIVGGVKNHHKNQFNNSYNPLGGFQFQYLGVDSKQQNNFVQNNQQLYNLSIVAVDGKKKCLFNAHCAMWPRLPKQAIYIPWLT